MICQDGVHICTDSGRCDGRQLSGPIIGNTRIAITSVPGQNTDIVGVNHGQYWCVS